MTENMMKFKPFLLRIAKTHLTTKNQMWAEDLVHEAFCKAIEAKDQFDDNSGKFITWLTTITKNTCIDFNRKKVNNELRLNHANFSGKELPFNSKKNKSNIRQYLNLLKERDQKILRLKYFFKLSSKEIASILKTKPNNVPMFVRRAKNNLLTILKDNDVQKNDCI